MFLSFCLYFLFHVILRDHCGLTLLYAVLQTFFFFLNPFARMAGYDIMLIFKKLLTA